MKNGLFRIALTLILWSCFIVVIPNLRGPGENVDLKVIAIIVSALSLFSIAFAVRKICEEKIQKEQKPTSETQTQIFFSAHNMSKTIISLLLLQEGVREIISHAVISGLVHVVVGFGLISNYRYFRRAAIAMLLVWALMFVGLFFPFMELPENVFLPNTLGGIRIWVFLAIEIMLVLLAYQLKDDKKELAK